MYQLKRPHPASDLIVNFRCGCQVKWLGSTEFRTARQESCAIHEAGAAAVDRGQIFDVACTRKRMLLALGW